MAQSIYEVALWQLNHAAQSLLDVAQERPQRLSPYQTELRDALVLLHKADVLLWTHEITKRKEVV